MTNYSRGATFERKIKKEYEGDGWYVIRSAGSRGPVDLVAIHWQLGVELIQCKLRKPTKREREAFIAFLKERKLMGRGKLVWPNGEEVIDG